MTGDIDEWLWHWERWARRTGDCYPGGWICGSAEASLWVPYRNGDASIEEKLEELEARMEPDVHIAERVERWVTQMGEPMRTAIRVDRVHLPEPMRLRLHRSDEEWLAWRARAVNRALRERYPGCWHIQPPDYQEAVWSAIDGIRRQMLIWARGV